jgi:hypothetical protein
LDFLMTAISVVLGFWSSDHRITRSPDHPISIPRAIDQARGSVGNFGNGFIAPPPPPSTPKNMDLADSSPALIFRFFGIEVQSLEPEIYSSVNMQFTD